MLNSNVCSLLIPLANLILVKKGTNPSSIGFLLQENGGHLLLESGGKIIL